MSDPLSVIRDAIMHNKPIQMECEKVTAGKHTLLVQEDTAFRSKDGFYSVGAVVLLVLNPDLKFSEYFVLCRKNDIKKAIAWNEQKDLLRYLRGRQSTLKGLDVAKQLEQQTVKGIPADEDNASETLRRTVHDASQDAVENDKDGDVAIVTLKDGIDFRKEEFELSSRVSILRHPGKSFASAIETYDRTMKEEKPGRKGESKRRRCLDGRRDRGQPEKKGKPIILVPSGSKSILTIYNAKEFFENGTFVMSQEKQEEFTKSKTPRPEMITIQRPKCNDRSKLVEFQVYDSVAGFSSNDWNRVVAVFVQGQPWQFKNWKIGKTPADLFANAYCCHVHFDDENPHENIIKWGLKSYKVSKTRSHNAMSIFSSIWKQIEQFIQANKETVVEF